MCVNQLYWAVHMSMLGALGVTLESRHVGSLTEDTQKGVWVRRQRCSYSCKSWWL